MVRGSLRRSVLLVALGGCGSGESASSVDATPDVGGGADAADPCASPITFEMLPSQATHSGDWELRTSGSGEGEISLLVQASGTAGSILYRPEITCASTWFIWVRYFDQGTDDSYFVTVDGAPDPKAIFEGDCTAAGSGYGWDALSWREPLDPPCTGTDPWAQSWTVGVHEVEFSFRESIAMGRILLTTDPSVVPD